MTQNKFMKDFKSFLENSTVNLGRKGAKTRRMFINAIIDMVDKYIIEQKSVDNKKEQTKNKAKSATTDDRILCIKPKENRSLNIGKGVHAMTQSKSMEADQQLGRSPLA